MRGYGVFADFYDGLIQDVPYTRQMDFILTCQEKYGNIAVQIAADFGCGTGTLSCLLAEHYKEVIGIDASEEMLMQARQKAAEQNKDILFLCQSLQQVDLYGTIELGVCTLDTLNHITVYSQLKQALQRMALFIQSGGLFIFDVNTLYKQEQILGDNTFVYDIDGLFCCWQNQYNAKNHTTSIWLDFFQQQGEVYQRFSESFRERAYTHRQILNLLHASSLELLGCFDDYSFSPLREDSQRVVYVTRKR